ncbi:MAG: TonB-dependent receptor [Chitinophagales bacterium]
MLKQYFLFILFSISVLFTFAQSATLKGKILNEKGKAIFGAYITAQNISNLGTSSDPDGVFNLKIPANKEVKIKVSALNHTPQYFSYNLTNAQIKIVDFKLKIVSSYAVDSALVIGIKTEEEGYREGEQMLEIEVREAALPSPTNDISSFLEGQAFIQKNNELSTAYAVRGGNFDENLVYVNDFEVYRPFLIRSGQQEGLSFVNPDMVDKIAFSAGGFQSKYGDKLSSVLDVKYKRPRKFGGSVSASLLGANVQLEGTDKSRNFTFAVGARYKTSRLLLGALDVNGQYQPTFVDVQGFFTYNITENFYLEYISNFALNQFDFIPEDRTTDFGLVNFQNRFTVFYDNGSKENDRYYSLMNGLAAVYKPIDKMELKFLASAYNMTEYERFDLLGEYQLGEVESDPASENLGQVKNVIGSGAFHDWARNSLFTDVYSAAHKGKYEIKKHKINWGLTYKYEIIQDKLSEWQRVDSSGYNLEHSEEKIELYRVLKPDEFKLYSNRFSGYLQDTWSIGDTNKLSINYGVRFQYWDINKKFILTPRAQVLYKPKVKNGHLELKFAGGLYYQQAFYREMRNFEGVVNTDLKPQKSAHFIAGVDYSFKAWKRKFRFITETYYKYLWDIVPYKYDNVLIRYYGENNSKGYAAGVDFRLNGQLAEGLESWVTLSFMSTEEDILDDFYTEYTVEKSKIEAGGEIISEKLDTTNIENVFPGYIARPSDQRVRFALFFQDYIPKFPYVKVHLNLVIATGLPFGPPDTERYQDKFRATPYRRFDIGFSASLYNKKIRLKKNKPIKKGLKHLENVWFSFEVFNLFAIKNIANYTWVDAYDVRTQSLGKYAIPNYLTDRRFNAKLQVNF